MEPSLSITPILTSVGEEGWTELDEDVRTSVTDDGSELQLGVLEKDEDSVIEREFLFLKDDFRETAPKLSHEVVLY